MSGTAELLAEIFETIAKIEQKVKELQDAINAGLESLSRWLGWVADRVHDGWNWFCDKIGEFWDWLSNIVTHMGDPEMLSATADAWSDSIGGPVSAEVGNADAGSLLVDDTWTGMAAEQYKQRIALQKTALDKVRATFSEGISTALKDMRMAIWVYWGALVAALATLVGGLIGAIGSSATVFGLPAAPFIAAAAVGACLVACWGGGEILKSQAANANTVLRQKLNDNSGFPDDAWPAGAAG